VNKLTLGNDLRRSQLSSEGHKNYLSRKMSLERSQSPRKDSTGRWSSNWISWFSSLISINILTKSACHGLNANHPFFGFWLSWTLDRHRLTSRAVRNFAAFVTWQASKVPQIALSISGSIILRLSYTFRRSSKKSSTSSTRKSINDFQKKTILFSEFIKKSHKK